MQIKHTSLRHAALALGAIVLAGFLTGCMSADARKMHEEAQDRNERSQVSAEDLNVPIPANHPLFDAIAVGRVKYKEASPGKNDDDILRSRLALALMNVKYFALQKEDARYIADAVILEAVNSGIFSTKAKTVVEYTLRETSGGTVVYRKTLIGTASESGSSMTAPMKDSYVRWNALRETVLQFLSDITVAVSSSP